MTTTNLIAANTLAALKALWNAVDAGVSADPAIWANATILTKAAIAHAEGAGVRAQSFAERERDLLEANNRHLEAARAARAAHIESNRKNILTLEALVELLGEKKMLLQYADTLRKVDVLAIAKEMAGPEPMSREGKEEPSWPVDLFELERAVIAARSKVGA